MIARKNVNNSGCKRFSPIAFSKIQKQANNFADKIEKNKEELINILLEYESYEVAIDEIERTLDLLKSLEENKEYFHLRIGAVTSFLPRNQPLYALSCFVLIPSLMSEEVYFRVPVSMRELLPRIIDFLDVLEIFPNVIVSKKERLEFLTERSSLYTDSNIEETWPITDVVIFTGTSTNANQLRLVFDSRTLFITNGSGHNPIVIGNNANIKKAVEATLTLTLYNQGQDCAAPNTILIHQNIYHDFIITLVKELKKIKIGPYKDRECRVGPISDPKDLIRIEELLIDNRKYIHPNTPGIINTTEAILEPVIIEKPLKDGGNYDEVFAPIIFVQKYNDENDLKNYFENTKYLQNAMYVTFYGDSEYVPSLVRINVEGKKLHDKFTILHNTHLHIPGVERGTEPYGGFGLGASSISINRQIIHKAPLPQRDIYEWLVKPLLKSKKQLNDRKSLISKLDKIVEKDIPKLLKLKPIKDSKETKISIENAYVDTLRLNKVGDCRYVKLDKNSFYELLDHTNINCISELSLKEIKCIQSLKKLVEEKKDINEDDFKKKLYAIPNEPELNEEENRNKQLVFFKIVYNLLFEEDSGPNLNNFLFEIDNEKIIKLLDI